MSPSIDVRFPASAEAQAALEAKVPALRGTARERGDLDDDAVDAARQPRPRVPSRRRLRVLPRRGHGRTCSLIARALRESALARWNRFTGALGEPLAEMKGAAFEGMRFRHPWIDRDSPGVLGDYVTLDTGTGVVHTAPGHGWDDYLTGVRYGLDIYCPVDEAGRFLPEVGALRGQEGLRRQPRGGGLAGRERARCSPPARRSTPTRSAGAARTRSSSAPPSSGSSASTATACASAR